MHFASYSRPIINSYSGLVLPSASPESPTRRPRSKMSAHLPVYNARIALGRQSIAQLSWDRAYSTVKRPFYRWRELRHSPHLCTKPSMCWLLAIPPDLKRQVGTGSRLDTNIAPFWCERLATWRRSSLSAAARRTVDYTRYAAGRWPLNFLSRTTFCCRYGVALRDYPCPVVCSLSVQTHQP